MGIVERKITGGLLGFKTMWYRRWRSLAGSQNWGLQQVQRLVRIILDTLIEVGKSCHWFPWLGSWYVQRRKGTEQQYPFFALWSLMVNTLWPGVSCGLFPWAVNQNKPFLLLSVFIITKGNLRYLFVQILLSAQKIPSSRRGKMVISWSSLGKRQQKVWKWIWIFSLIFNIYILW